jgi:hypothetical protein
MTHRSRLQKLEQAALGTAADNSIVLPRITMSDAMRADACRRITLDALRLIGSPAVDPFPGLQGAEYLEKWWAWFYEHAENWPDWAQERAVRIGRPDSIYSETYTGPQEIDLAGFSPAAALRMIESHNKMREQERLAALEQTGEKL